MPDSVSSLGNAKGGWDPVGNHSYAVRKPASQFTTGGNSGGYDLLSVTIEISGVDQNPGDLTVAIYTNDSNNRPGILVTTLSGSNPTGSGQHTFTCSSNCTLSASTKYQLWLSALNAPSGYNFYRWRTSTSSGETTEPTGNGWSIGESIMQIDSSWSDLTPYFKYKVTAARR